MCEGSDNGAPRLASVANGAAAAPKRPPRRYVLRDRELRMVAAYKYKGAGYTYLDNVMTPFWNRAVTWLPRWTAPNLVTFAGLMSVGLSSIPLMYYSPTLRETVPSWVYLLLAAALFVYQTLDAIDGKQARRTNSSSPLGQLFDHGCDALVKVFLLIELVACQQYGGGWKALLVLVNTEVSFYMAQWEEYHTGTLNWSNGVVGVTETQFTQMALFVVTAIGGEQIWSRRLFLAPWVADEALTLAVAVTRGVTGPEIAVSGFWKGGLGGMTIGEALIVVFVATTFSMMVGSLLKVAKAKISALPAEEQGDKRVGLLPGLVQLMPLLLVLGMGCALVLSPCSEAFAARPALLIVAVETVSVHVTTRMIVHHMAKQPLWLQDLQCPAVFALFLACLDCYWQPLGLGDAPPLPATAAVAAVAAVAVASYLYYVVGSVRDICNHINVRCFHIEHPRID